MSEGERMSVYTTIAAILHLGNVTFEDDPTHLFLARNEKVNEIKKKRESNRKTMDSDSDSSEGLDLADVFKGHNVKAYDIPSEKKMWQFVN